MWDDQVRTFVTRSHRRVIEHCDALLAQDLTEMERSRLLALRETAEAEFRKWDVISKPQSGTH
jgi:hypothetical protein